MTRDSDVSQNFRKIAGRTRFSNSKRPRKICGPPETKKKAVLPGEAFAAILIQSDKIDLA